MNNLTAAKAGAYPDPFQLAQSAEASPRHSDVLTAAAACANMLNTFQGVLSTRPLTRAERVAALEALIAVYRCA
jgi:hypothetical protein